MISSVTITLESLDIEGFKENAMELNDATISAASAETLMTANDVMSMFSISSTTLWRHLNNGILPQPFRLGKKRYWKYSDVLESVSALNEN